MSTLDAARVLAVHSLHVPPAGGWLADLWLDATALPAIGAATLTVGDLVLVGRVTQAGMDDHPTGGARPRVTHQGGAGWDTLLSRPGVYTAADGVRLSTVLRDLAALCGETYDAPATDALLPPAYRWPASTPREPVRGRDVLADLMTRGAIPTWRVVPETGRTAFSQWPTLGAADSAGRVLSRNLARGRRTVGLDVRVQAFLPGSSVESVTTRRLIVAETARKLTAEVFAW